jgi:hypothetical protein
VRFLIDAHLTKQKLGKLKAEIADFELLVFLISVFRFQLSAFPLAGRFRVVDFS